MGGTLQPHHPQNIPEFAENSLIADRFKVVAKLGSGTSGVVYLCLDKEVGGLKVAVKLFPSAILKEGNVTARIQRELLTLNAIDHPNVIRFYDSFRDENVLGYCMEYVEGCTLEELISDEQPMGFDFILQIGENIAAGLEAIHTRDLIHRDLKPANILVAIQGSAKISDFGLVRGNDDEIASDQPRNSFSRKLDPTATLSKSSGTVGTPFYMSPEYFAKGMIDHRTDIYAAGLIMYEMVTKTSPFQYTSAPEFLVAKVERDPPPPDHFNERCPPQLSALIMRAMCRNPNERIQSATELKQQVQAVRAATRTNFYEDEPSVLSRKIQERGLKQGTQIEPSVFTSRTFDDTQPGKISQTLMTALVAIMVIAGWAYWYHPEIAISMLYSSKYKLLTALGIKM